MSQGISTSIDQRYIDGTVVAVNNGSVNNADVNSIRFQPTMSRRQCTKCANDKHQKANLSLQYIQYRLQQTSAELTEKEHRRAIKAWNKFKPCGLLLEIKEFQDWFNMQCQQSYMIEYIREKKIKRPSEPYHLLYYYIDNTVTGSSYHNLQEAFRQQAYPEDRVQVHGFRHRDSEDSTIIDELFGKLAATQGDTYIVIDGLDKLPQRHSDELLSRLCNLSEKLKGGNTYSGGHLAVAISSQNTPSLDRGKGYDKVFDLRLGPNYISSDNRKYLGNSSNDSTIFMGTTDLRRQGIQAHLENGTTIYPCLSSSMVYKAQRQLNGF
ncbi:hypothetical protein CFAM422_000698 [Trichoderma lentiforme]|uniref:Uncharacterized protein n=1 Tax=Trichoderma lentiforme TaxID=1567552 RepID=A0A9P5CGB2_9HYPO|nr:hypothetical protein CFAM422_000698 [Trichoderma lentiforme]